MESLLVKLMVLAALSELGLTVLGTSFFLSRSCLVNTDSATRKILRIEWKPISVFPEEAKRFRKNR